MFKGVLNEKLDKIRIAEVSGKKNYYYVRGEAGSAYFDDLQVKKFDRNFLYVAPDYFIIWDELETVEPADFTFLLSADREIKLNGNIAELINEAAMLRVIRVAANSKVVSQMIQARGLPGSVDKGDSEQRGVQLQTVSIEKQTKFEFIHFLQPLLTSDINPAPKIQKTTVRLKIIWANGDEDTIELRGATRSVERTRNSKTLPKLSLKGN